MPRSEEANMQIKDERQQRILSSALKVFIRKGFAATKISDIAVEAGMSNGLMYHYFQSKEEIYAELVRRAAMFSRRLLEQVQADSSEPIDQLRSLAVRIFRTVEQQQAGGHYFVLILEAMTSGVYPAHAIECEHGSGGRSRYWWVSSRRASGAARSCRRTRHSWPSPSSRALWGFPCSRCRAPSGPCPTRNS